MRKLVRLWVLMGLTLQLDLYGIVAAPGQAGSASGDQRPNLMVDQAALQDLRDRLRCGGKAKLLIGLEHLADDRDLLGSIGIGAADGAVQLQDVPLALIEVDDQRLEALTRLPIESLHELGAERARVLPGQDDLTRLRALAAEHGAVRVVVTLALSQPTAEDLATAQDLLLQNMATFEVRNVQRFNVLPQLAMTVDTAGLDHLASTPLVCAIHGDRIDLPQDGGRR